MSLAKALHGERIARADVIVAGDPLPYPDAHFDGLVSMDVIEHVPDPAAWLAEAFRVVRPGGRVFLTTPNYASRSLILLERTVLEVIARAQGFSRKALHPSKLDSGKLAPLVRRGERGAHDPRSHRLRLGARRHGGAQLTDPN